MSGFDYESFIEEADEKLIAADDWERLEVWIELCNDEIFDVKEVENYESVKAAGEYLTDQKRVIRESAFNYILRAIDHLKYREEILPLLDQKILELELLSHERSFGTIDVLVEKTKVLRRHYANKGNLEDKGVVEKSNSILESGKFKFRGARAELRYLLNEIYDRWVEDSLSSKAEFFRTLAPLFQDAVGEVSESDVDNMLKKVNHPPSSAKEVDKMLDEAEEKRFDDI